MATNSHFAENFSISFLACLNEKCDGDLWGQGRNVVQCDREQDVVVKWMGATTQ